ncbi:MAG: hypothetical protein ACK4NR_06005 [Micavibrio sp.]
MTSAQSPAPRRDREQERLERQLKSAKFQHSLTSYFAIATAMTSIFMITSMDDGERMDLHQMVKDKPQYEQLATETENKIKLACVFFSLMGGGLTQYRQRKVRKAQEALDNYKPEKPAAP